MDGNIIDEDSMKKNSQLYPKTAAQGNSPSKASSPLTTKASTNCLPTLGALWHLAGSSDSSVPGFVEPPMIEDSEQHT